MAEGGNQDDSNSPYSFGYFVKNGKGNDIPSEEDNDAGVDKNCSRRRDKGSATNDDNEKSQNRRDDNPFSFRQFLKKDTSRSTGSSNVNSSDKELEPSSSSVRFFSNGSAPDFANGLPDFVQGHFKLEGSNPSGTSKDADVLPDFTNGPNHTNNHERPASNISQDSLYDQTFNEGHFRADVKSEVIMANTLPDFLSDGPMLSNVCERVKTEELPSSKKSSNKLFNKEISESRARTNGNSASNHSHVDEIERLHYELDHTRDLLARERERVKELSSEIKKLKKKDKEDVVALEMMVQQVENNMQGTNERAAAAETSISRLKLEIKSLQSQLSSVMKENEILKNSSYGRHIITEKAKTTADQMRLAAETAQKHLMQLLSGVDTLKLMANNLMDIDTNLESPTDENT